jgi:hypothetical protein
MDYYEQNDILVALHNYSIADIEDMYPYERDIYVEMVVNRRRAQENA